MKHLKKFNEEIDNTIVWVGALDDDYNYIPISCELDSIYKGVDALPYFNTEEECQEWCDENPYQGEKPTVESLNTLISNIMDALKVDADYIKENDPELFDHIGDMIKRWKEDY